MPFYARQQSISCAAGYGGGRGGGGYGGGAPLNPLNGSVAEISSMRADCLRLSHKGSHAMHDREFQRSHRTCSPVLWAMLGMSSSLFSLQAVLCRA